VRNARKRGEVEHFIERSKKREVYYGAEWFSKLKAKARYCRD
jgi:hypothetical protein